MDPSEAEELLDREQYNRFRVSPADPSTMRCEDVERCLRSLAESSAGRLKVEKWADSFQNRPIYLATVGEGPRRVLLWSQMHGNEPTHTAVLLDLINYLVQSPELPGAADILSGCRLFIIPMLNPDGVERGIRFNAQHVDVNRDAVRLQTPEGRALRRAVETIQPDFGFNLHNQNARTSVGTPARPIVAAVLAPAIDAQNSETHQIREAKRVAACFINAVRQRTDGMVARYEAEFMPWSFGEWVQSKGVVTVLVEAGGWPGPDPTPMVELQYDALFTALGAIATGRYRDVDPSVYDELPVPNDTKLFDCVVAGGFVFNAQSKMLMRADVGINHSLGQQLYRTRKPDGQIFDIGDLGAATGKVTIDATGCLVLPGRLTLVNDVPFESTLLNSLLAAGVTTAIVCVDLTNLNMLQVLESVPLPAPAINIGFIARLVEQPSDTYEQQIARVMHAVSRGVLAVGGNLPGVTVGQCLDWFGIPKLNRAELESRLAPGASYRELGEDTWKMHERLGLHDRRGWIGSLSTADLLCFDVGGKIDPSQPVDWGRLKCVIVAGEPVWIDGKRTTSNPGTILRRPTENRPC